MCIVISVKCVDAYEKLSDVILPVDARLRATRSAFSAGRIVGGSDRRQKKVRRDRTGRQGSSQRCFRLRASGAGAVHSYFESDCSPVNSQECSPEQRCENSSRFARRHN